MKKKEKKSKVLPRTRAEWVSLVVALVLVGGLVATIIVMWLTGANTPPSFTIERGAPRSESGLSYLPVTVTNTGDLTGSQVMVEGRLMVDGREEVSSTTFDFVPGHSRSEGVLIFSGDPANAAVRIVSFQAP